MAIQSEATRNALAAEYASRATHGAVYTTAPGTAAGTEPVGGDPAYARLPLTWGAPANGVITATAVVFNIPAGTTIVGTGVHGALTATAGDYVDGKTEASVTFDTQDTLTVTYTYSQS